MSVAIRLQRIGKPKLPYYRVVAIDSRRPCCGKPIEVIGSYNPRAEKAKDKFQVKQERYDHWVKVGAKPSETVGALLRALSKPSADKVPAKRVKKGRKGQEEAKAAAPAAAAPKAEEKAA